MPPVKIEQVRDAIFTPSIASIVVDLDNFDSYQLRVTPDGIGNVYVWVDYRPKFGKWTKLVELQNGKQRTI